MSDVVSRFMRYARINTQSDPAQDHLTPSTQRQHDLARLLAEELTQMGAQDVTHTDTCYVTAFIPASAGYESAKTLALIAHLDSSPDAAGQDVDPRIITYQGGDITLTKPEENPTVIAAADTPDLADMIGKELIVSDGTTLIAADDKAGIAEIMALAKRLLDDPELAHPRLALCFTPDEEIGHGASLLDIERLGAQFGYTIDGGALGEIEYENFNAAEATVTFTGTMVHPGSAKHIMVNALHLFSEFDALLPACERPEHTEGYEGFYHLIELNGTAENAQATYLIREFDKKEFENKKKFLEEAAAFLNKKQRKTVVQIACEDSYYNMAELVKPHQFLVERAQTAFELCGYTPCVLPIRGGTDGAQLSYRGLICPNLSAGGYNFHSMREFIPVFALEGMVDVLEALVSQFK